LTHALDLGRLITPELALALVALFCRVGTCLMLAPGLSATQIPTQIRLFGALAATLSLAPAVLDPAALRSVSAEPIALLRTIAFESMIGGMIGILGRMFFLALESIAFAAATMLGFSNPFGIEVEANEQLPPFATLIGMTATLLVFALDLHLEILRGLAASYSVIPMGSDFNAQFALSHVADALTSSFRAALRVCSPFVIYAVIVNLAMAAINRLTPQVAVYYVATPFVLGGGLLLLYLTIRPLLGAFEAEFTSWLAWG
jgi:flagellar biosynthesis protein FliR